MKGDCKTIIFPVSANNRSGRYLGTEVTWRKRAVNQGIHYPHCWGLWWWKKSNGFPGFYFYKEIKEKNIKKNINKRIHFLIPNYLFKFFCLWNYFSLQKVRNWCNFAGEKDFQGIENHAGAEAEISHFHNCLGVRKSSFFLAILLLSKWLSSAFYFVPLI